MTAVTGADDLSMEDLVRLARAESGPRGIVREIERHQNDFSTKLASEFITLHFEDGTDLPLLVKKAIDGSERHRPQPPDREMRTYQDLGAHPAFAAPRFFGTIGSDDPWLVLAAVDGWDLRYHDLDRWAVAARALGCMQRSFHDDLETLRRLDHLIRHDGAHGLADATGALAAIAPAHPKAAALLRPVVNDYADVAAELEAQPATLVHGDLAPKNVLIEGSDGSESALFVDWEWTGIGLGMIDLVDLVNGLDEAATERLLRVYVDETKGSAVPEDESVITRCFHLAHLQRIMFRLGRSSDWNVSGSEVLAWAKTAADLHASL